MKKKLALVLALLALTVSFVPAKQSIEVAKIGRDLDLNDFVLPVGGRPSARA